MTTAPPAADTDVPSRSTGKPGASTWHPLLERRGSTAIAVVVLAAVLLAAVLVLPPFVAGGAALGLSVLFVLRRRLFTWDFLFFALLAVIMFVPIRRYAVPIPLPFALEPYRVVLAILIVVVAGALLFSRQFRWQPLVFGWAVVGFIVALCISLVFNSDSLVAAGLTGASLGAILQMAFLLSVFFFGRQLITSERWARAALLFITWGGVVVGAFAVFERITRTNVFLLFGNILPLTLLRDDAESLRSGAARSFGSAQHPIALAVALCMIIPLAVYFSKYASWPRNQISRRLLYAGAVLVMGAGMMTSVSRTGIVVLGVMFLVVLILQPLLAATFIALAFPILIAMAAFLPTVFDSTVGAFLDLDSLIQSQYASPGFRGQGRLADLEPAFREVALDPFFGTGPGSRIVIGEDANAYILDNQVLGSLLETGVVGLAGLALLMLVPPVWMVRAAFDQRLEPRIAHMAFALAVAMTGYVAAMFFYDAFSFMQTFLILCVLWAVGAWLITEKVRGVDPSAKPALRDRLETSWNRLWV